VNIKLGTAAHFYFVAEDKSQELGFIRRVGTTADSCK
jgi:hypothetical protein